MQTLDSLVEYVHPVQTEPIVLLPKDLKALVASIKQRKYPRFGSINEHSSNDIMYYLCNVVEDVERRTRLLPWFEMTHQLPVIRRLGRIFEYAEEYSNDMIGFVTEMEDVVYAVGRSARAWDGLLGRLIPVTVENPRQHHLKTLYFQYFCSKESGNFNRDG